MVLNKNSKKTIGNFKRQNYIKINDLTNNTEESIVEHNHEIYTEKILDKILIY